MAYWRSTAEQRVFFALVSSNPVCRLATLRCYRMYCRTYDCLLDSKRGIPINNENFPISLELNTRTQLLFTYWSLLNFSRARKEFIRRELSQSNGWSYGTTYVVHNKGLQLHTTKVLRVSPPFIHSFILSFTPRDHAHLICARWLQAFVYLPKIIELYTHTKKHQSN